MTVIERIRAQVRQHPDRAAYRVNEDELTYAELWTRAEEAAAELRRLGRSPVVLYGSMEAAMPIGILACLMSRRAYVPVEPATPAYRLEQMIRQCGAGLLLTESDDAPDCDIPVCSLSALKGFSAEENGVPLDAAYVVYTSGSTGTPKGVPISEENLESFVRWLCGLEPLCAYREIRVMHLASFSFDLSVTDLYYALCCGHTLVACTAAAANPAELYAFLRRERINLIVATPTFGRLLTLDRSVCSETLPVLLGVYFCGETLQPSLARRLFDAFPDLALLNAYGPTEATSAVCACRITRRMAETETVLPIGAQDRCACTLRLEDGEIVLLGSSVTKGYLGGVKGGCFTENGVSGYHSGDRGELRDGLLYCLGRSDRQIKYKGCRVELDDIEANLAALRGVRSCAVVARRGSDGTVRAIAAFVVPADETVAASALKAELRQRLPAYMIPGSFRLLSALPVNQNGKTDRKALMAL